MELFSLALYPVIAIIIYIYIRDKYEKEPWDLLLLGVGYGAFFTMPIILCEKYLLSNMPNLNFAMKAFYSSFFVASFTEEGFKFIILYFLAWKNKNFNEPFDGIVYAVFISLGFAFMENILFIFNPKLGGINTAIGRTLISVPAHAIFGVSMGYNFAFAKFISNKRNKFILLSFIYPFILHGTFNFLLSIEIPFIMAIFFVFNILIWLNAFKKMKAHVEISPFKNKKTYVDNKRK